MEIKQTVTEWKQMIIPALKSKAEELEMMGYSQASPEDVWSCLKQKVWKGEPEKRLHEIVQDVLHLASGTYLSYLTMSSYQNDNLMASIAALTGKEE
ncbi:post-transcriptional regulator [Oceanobacillus saliphilus]|uniref:post-transcriptional regulator n=1 Tax=Oceanobacillus saliphilus TaxID=2925834 RepID=UPI00201E0E45|nr:post-transcriptional regulator [Oceanobacillus saliphilus]